MLTTVWANDKILGIKSLAQRVKFKKAIVSWLVIGDLHTCIVNKVYSYPDKANYEESLRKLLRRIIRNSIIIGLKDKGYWYSQHIRTKLPFSEEELYEILMIDIQTERNAAIFCRRTSIQILLSLMTSIVAAENVSVASWQKNLMQRNLNT